MLHEEEWQHAGEASCALFSCLEHVPSLRTHAPGVVLCQEDGGGMAWRGGRRQRKEEGKGGEEGYGGEGAEERETKERRER